MSDRELQARTAPAAIAPVGLFDFLCGKWARFAVACGECGNQFLAMVDPQGAQHGRCPCCGHVNVWFPPPRARQTARIIPFREGLRALGRFWNGGGDDAGGTAVAA